ncbi:MAG: hypothetical protein F6K28_28560 [Microcoleus sp. SIO2G3]|nr:hypothetical protein [Microcoleus sp. SIO2G3]
MSAIAFSPPNALAKRCASTSLSYFVLEIHYLRSHLHQEAIAPQLSTSLPSAIARLD